MKLARELREIELYKFTPIVFITAVPTRELEAFRQIHCYEYIIKPFEDDEVKEIVETIITHSIKSIETKPIIKMVQKELTHVIHQDSIIYIEARNRKVYFKTLNDELTFSTYTLGDVFKELTKDFMQCHRSYIINKRFIKVIDKRQSLVKLHKTDMQIPYSRKYKDQIVEVDI